MNIRAFVPGERYPAISITGRHCALNCRYCRGYFLRSMYSATTPRQLYSIARRLHAKGAKGILVSGGYGVDGCLPIKPFLSVIREIKTDFGLIMSLHSGLVDGELASQIRSSGIDIVDFQLIVDPIIIQELQGLNKKPEDYLKSLELLVKLGPTYIAPHLPLGFRYGRMVTEWNAVDLVKDFRPYIVVFLILNVRSPLGAGDFIPPKGEEVLNVLAYSKSLDCEKAMGCMRPTEFKSKLDDEMIEKELVDRIAVPHTSLIRKWKLEIVRSCCSLPKEFIDRFID
ncbi:MAG: radical SAM protein [Nitrososphaeria archaeon]